MGTIHQFPSVEEREHGFFRRQIPTYSEQAFMDVNVFLSSLDSLRLPSLIKNDAINIYTKLKQLPSIEKLACRLFLQDLVTYGKPNSDAACDFLSSNPKLASKIISFDSDIQRSIYHILGNYVSDNTVIDALRSTKHLFGRVMGIN